MASGFTLHNNLRELWLSITTSHVNYLCEDKSPVKIKYREILQNRIKEFLYVIPHKKKFSFSKTEEILRRSIQSEEFNALKAASAWLAISMYANNLYSQPWRNEFHEIKLYSGFYKHQVENCLWGAEAMLQLMGYKRVPESKMVLEGPINFDRVSAVSLDALIAMCECQVMFSIFKEISKHIASCTWMDIFRFRELYPGTVEQTIRIILSLSCYPPQYYTDCMYGYTPYREPGCPKCPEMTVLKPSHVLVPMNGYRHCYSNNVHVSSNDRLLFAKDHYSHVPTAKLIDLDDSFQPSCSQRCRKTSCERWPSKELHYFSTKEAYASSDNSSFFDEDTARSWDKDSRRYDNRINSRRSWEYVYKGLEDKGMKDQNYKRTLPLNHKSKTSPTMITNGLTETFSSLKLNCETNAEGLYLSDNVDGHNCGMQQHEPFVKSQLSKNTKSSDEVRPKPCSLAVTGLENNDEVETPKWECSKCTYYNKVQVDVCEMCDKSKNVNSEVPLISGGKHCSRCTLVNKKEATKCEACDANLKGSPTYV